MFMQPKWNFLNYLAQSAGTVEYTDGISSEE